MKNKKIVLGIISIVGIIIIGMLLCIPRGKSYDIKIIIPAGSMDKYVYSDEEISSQKKKIKITGGEGLGDTEVILKPVEVTEESTYKGFYLTHGMTSEIEVEKGVWFKVGVNIQNPTDEDMVVYVNVSNIGVRIE